LESDTRAEVDFAVERRRSGVFDAHQSQLSLLLRTVDGYFYETLGLLLDVCEQVFVIESAEEVVFYRISPVVVAVNVVGTCGIPWPDISLVEQFELETQAQRVAAGLRVQRQVQQ
jgi:hypothetical protein